MRQRSRAQDGADSRRVAESTAVGPARGQDGAVPEQRVPGPGSFAPEQRVPGPGPGNFAPEQRTGDPAAARVTGGLVTFVLAALSAVPPLSMDMYLPALPEVTGSLSASAATVQVTLTACLAGLALGQLVAGPLSDRFGRRAPLLVGLVLYVLATAACALAPNAGALVVCRLVQGLAGAAGIVIARAVVRDLYEGVEMARFFSTLLLISGTAPILAPLIGSQVLRFTDWRGVFAVLTVTGLALTVLVVRFLPETLPPARRHTGGGAETVRALRALLADREFTGYVLCGGFAFAALFSYISASPFVVQDLYGASPQTFSLLFGLNSVGLMASAQLSGRFLAGRVPLAAVITTGLAAGVAATTVLLLMTGGAFGDVSLAPVAAALFVTTTAMGLVLPNAAALALQRAPRAAGSASALVGAASFLTGALLSPLVGIAGEDTALPMAVVQTASLLLAAACLVGLCRPWRRPATGVAL